MRSASRRGAIREAKKTARRTKMARLDLQPDALGVSDIGAKAFDNLFAKPMSHFRRAPVCRAV